MAAKMCAGLLKNDSKLSWSFPDPAPGITLYLQIFFNIVLQHLIEIPHDMKFIKYLMLFFDWQPE